MNCLAVPFTSSSVPTTESAKVHSALLEIDERIQKARIHRERKVVACYLDNLSPWLNIKRVLALCSTHEYLENPFYQELWDSLEKRGLKPKIELNSTPIYRPGGMMPYYTAWCITCTIPR